MFKRIMVVAGAGLFFWAVGGGLSFAEDIVSYEAVEVVNVGNKICPVTGEKIEAGEGMTPVTYEYEGKIYNFCCPECIDIFKSDPKKYIAIVEKELSQNL